MKVTVCQLDNRNAERQAMLIALAAHIAEHQSQLLLLPEMCFADWLAADREPRRERWLAAIKAHAEQILDLGKLGVAAVIATRRFCRHCGSSLSFASPNADPELVEIALGCLDDEVPVKPDAHIFVSSGASWARADDDLPHYQAGRDGKRLR